MPSRAVYSVRAQCGEPAERGSFGVNDFGCLLDVVGAPFPLAGRAGGWVVRLSGFIVESFASIPWALQAGNLNVSPLLSTAQAMRAFFAAMATTAFQ